MFPGCSIAVLPCAFHAQFAEADSKVKAVIFHANCERGPRESLVSMAPEMLHIAGLDKASNMLK